MARDVPSQIEKVGSPSVGVPAMKRLFFEHLESRALPAANPLAGPLVAVEPETVNNPPTQPDTLPNEAFPINPGGGQASPSPQNGRSPTESLVTPRGTQLEWDDGFWHLPSSASNDSRSPDESLTQQPTSNQQDEWERIWFLDQPAAVNPTATGQKIDLPNLIPETLAFEQAVSQFSLLDQASNIPPAANSQFNGSHNVPPQNGSLDQALSEFGQQAEANHGRPFFIHVPHTYHHRI